MLAIHASLKTIYFDYSKTRIRGKILYSLPLLLIYPSIYRSCLKLLGYFNTIPFCYHCVHKLYHIKSELSTASSSLTSSSPSSLSSSLALTVYLRCLPKHHHFESQDYYRNIIPFINYTSLYLLTSPDCNLSSSYIHSASDEVALVLRYSQVSSVFAY